MLGLIYLTENDDRFNTTQLPSHIINIPITNRIVAMQVHPNVADNLRFFLVANNCPVSSTNFHTDNYSKLYTGLNEFIEVVNALNSG